MTTVITNLSPEQNAYFQVDPNSIFEIIDVITLVSDSASITEITAKVQNDLIKVTGTARRSPGDKPNQNIGTMLSIARAHAALSKAVEKRARGLVEHYANMQEQRPTQLQKSAQWKQNILRVASSDDAIQRAALRAAREREGSWEPMTAGASNNGNRHS